MRRRARRAYVGPRRRDHYGVDREAAAECHPSLSLPFKTGEITLDMAGVLSVA